MPSMEDFFYFLSQAFFCPLSVIVSSREYSKLNIKTNFSEYDSARKKCFYTCLSLFLKWKCAIDDLFFLGAKVFAWA